MQCFPTSISFLKVCLSSDWPQIISNTATPKALMPLNFRFRFPLVKSGRIHFNILLSVSVLMRNVPTYIFLKICSLHSSLRVNYSYRLTIILSLFGPLFTGPNLFYYIWWKKCIWQHKKWCRKKFLFFHVSLFCEQTTCL